MQFDLRFTNYDLRALNPSDGVDRKAPPNASQKDSNKNDTRSSEQSLKGESTCDERRFPLSLSERERAGVRVCSDCIGTAYSRVHQRTAARFGLRNPANQLEPI